MAAAGLFGYLSYVYLTLPDVRPLARTNPTTTAFIELRRDEARRAGRKLTIRQHWVSYAHISPALKRAVLVTEDAAFFDHDGIDLHEIKASLIKNIEDGAALRGASTITQQLAKNLYLSPSRNPVRKLKELLITRRLEAALTKRRIFEIYLNVIEWGDGIFGCEAAARTYFGKSSSDLTREEAALLAGAIINPREHSPAKPTRRLLRRQQIILRRMGPVDQGGSGQIGQVGQVRQVRRSDESGGSGEQVGPNVCRSANPPGPDEPRRPVGGAEPLHADDAALARCVDELVGLDDDADVRGTGGDG